MGRAKRRQERRQPSRRIVGAGDGQATAGALRVGGHVTGRAVPPARISARGHSERLRPPLEWKGRAAEGRGREGRLRMCSVRRGAGPRDGRACEVGLSRTRTPRHSSRLGSAAFSREERREEQPQQFPRCPLSPWNKTWRRLCLLCGGLS